MLPLLVSNHAVVGPDGNQLQLCECQRAGGFPNGLGCEKEGWFISGFENKGTWVSYQFSQDFATPRFLVQLCSTIPVPYQTLSHSNHGNHHLGQRWTALAPDLPTKLAYRMFLVLSEHRRGLRAAVTRHLLPAMLAEGAAL